MKKSFPFPTVDWSVRQRSTDTLVPKDTRVLRTHGQKGSRKASDETFYEAKYGSGGAGVYILSTAKQTTISRKGG